MWQSLAVHEVGDDGRGFAGFLDLEGKLQLTVRSYEPEVREKLLSAIKRKALAAAASSGAPEPTMRRWSRS